MSTTDVPGSEVSARVVGGLAAATRVERRRGRFGRGRLRLNWLGLAGVVIILVFIIAAILAPLLTDHDPGDQDLLAVLQGPSRTHLLGTDNLGRDTFSRLLYGARITLTISIAAATGGLIVGVVVGLNAGYYGGRWDALLMRSVDVLLAFPSILLALTLVTILGFGIENIILAIGVVSIPAFARLARSTTLAIKSMEYVLAARAVGVGNLRLLWRHLFPNMIAPVVTLWTLRLGTSILTASGLGFLGLGVQPPTPEWGAMLGMARSYMQVAPYLVIVPGLAITLVALGFALMGDWLRDLLDPRMR